jgi:hypothetical protein
LKKADYIQWVSVVMDESTDVSDRTQFIVFDRGIDMQFNVADKKAA